MNKKEYYKKQLEAYLENEIIESEEFERFSQMLQSDLYDDVLFEEFKKAWNSQKLKQLPKDVSDRILNNIEIFKEKSNKKSAPNTRLRRIILPAFTAASILIFLLINGINLTNQSKTKVEPIQANTDINNDNNTISSEKNVILYGKSSLQLPDGSKAILNENSSLSYNTNFNTNTREVYIQGEVFFDVLHDSSKPFIVHSGKVSTTVLGTAFNVKSDIKNSKVEVTVTRGRVKVGDNKMTYGVITPNQQFNIDTKNNIHKKLSVNATLVTNWKEKYIFLNNISLEQAMQNLADLYSIKPLFKNNELKQIKVNATFLKEDSLSHILTVLEQVINANIKTENNGIVTISKTSN